jgi:hypothetical protein
MIFKLRTKPTQFVKGKTEETLCDIMKRLEENKLINDNYNDNYNDNGNDNYTEISEHLIDIIVTNNSLLETEMWKYRTVNKFNKEEDIQIHILSSKSRDFTNIDTYINKIQQTTDKNNLPNVLIVCYHTKRVCSDIVTLCNTFGGLHKMILPNIEKKYIIKFHISFDEPDANIGVTEKFISKINPFIKNGTIIGVLFITATPVDVFWNMLNKSGIKQLLNMNKDTTCHFDDDLKNYVSFKDHNVVEHNNYTNNPLGYIMDLFCKKKIDETSRKIIFVPGHLYTEKKGVGSHNEIEQFFICKEYVVLKINGTWKGFVYPDGTRESLEYYNDKHNIKGELRETLKHWSDNNKLVNLAITGYWVIERGITFNTINFNFTDMILSNYHLKALAKLIQLVGRGTGGIEYVDVMNVFCTTDIKNSIESFNEKLNKICSLNPELFNRTDFTTTKNTIPVKLVITDMELLKMLVELKIKSKKGYKKPFHDLLVKGIYDDKIIIHDHNNINKFDINSRILKGVRMYKEGDKTNVRRFKNFNDAFEIFKTTSQSCSITEYNIDFVKDKYEFNDFVNETDIFWITFKI